MFSFACGCLSAASQLPRRVFDGWLWECPFKAGLGCSIQLIPKGVSGQGAGQPLPGHFPLILVPVLFVKRGFSALDPTVALLPHTQSFSEA